VAPANEVVSVIDKVKVQKGVKLDHVVIEGANHFFENRVEQLVGKVGEYLDLRLGAPRG
jgi:hypothetical protein